MCGDGAVTIPETCDDGNVMGSDGCSDTCTRDVGYECEQEPSVCTDIDECSLEMDDCPAGDICVNIDGGFTCFAM
ncbi:hypothetical protein [Chondromyces apiculatus]|uniref:hypothetical protein n=1 Tax=Chondromyces apiculatus TaxID=51 RepID=UPI001E33F33B